MKWTQKFQKVFMAASFAEAGEWDKAKEIMETENRVRAQKKNKRRAYNNKKRAHVRAYKA